jgi:Toprim-like
MSYYQLHPAEGLYFSIAGGLNPTQPELLRRTLKQYPQATIYIATDNDLPTEQHPQPEGEHYYEIIRDLCPPTATVKRAKPPEPYKDWNDVLNNKPRTPSSDDHSHAVRITNKRNTQKDREPAH